MSSRRWTDARLMFAVVTIVLVATVPSPALDWLPFQVAHRLAPAGEWHVLYPPTSALSLFDVNSRYRDTAHEIVAAHTRGAFNERLLTAFVAPPPAALLTRPLSGFPGRWETLIVRLTLAVPIVLALLLTASVMTDRSARTRWSWVVFAATPLLWYVVWVGQSSAWMFVAATLSVAASTRQRDAAGGLALGMSAIFKVTPILVIAGLWGCGRRRLAAIAAAVTGLACLVTLPSTDGGWASFLSTSRHLASVVITDWNNASFDAGLLRIAVGATNLFNEPEWAGRSVAWLFRVAVIWVAARAALTSTRSPAARAAAVWVGWLAASPLLWIHYLVTLVPLVGVAPRPRGRLDAGILLVAALSAIVPARVAGLGPDAGGVMACAVWLAGAAWLLSNRCWNTE